MNVKMKKYLKVMVAIVLTFAMVSETWGGISFVSKAEKEVEVNAEVKATTVVAVPADAVEFPDKTENDWKTATLPDGDAYKLSTQDAFISFARASRSHTFEGKTVYLNTDIAYESSTFAGIGTNTATVSDGVAFQGTFDGQKHTISNMVVGSKGIFASIRGGTIKNLIIDKATKASTYNQGGGLLVSKAFILTDVRGCKIDNVTIKNSTMTANYDRSAILVGYSSNTFPISNCRIENSTMNCTRTELDSASLSGYGLVLGYSNQKVNFNNVHVVDSAMTFDANTWVSNVGGLVGYSTKGGYITNCSIKNTKETPVISGLFAQANEPNPNQKKDVVMGDATKGWLIDGLDPDKAKVSENIGGVIGYVGGVFNAKDVEVDNVDISMKNVLGNVGGFAGYVSFANTSEDETTFTNCHVKNANIVSTQFIWDPGYKKVNGEATTEELPTEEKHYYHNVAGLVACVDKKASFTECSVVDTVAQTQSRYRCGGGLIGSTFTYRTDSEGLPSKGILSVSKCSVVRTVIKTGNSRNCNVVGGLIALLSEGSTVTDCYVYDYATPDNRNSLYVGGLIGDVYDIQKGSLKDGKTVVKNCYVGKAHLQGFNFVGEVIGDTDDGVDVTGFSNLLYCTTDTKITRNPDRDNPSIATFDAVKGKSHATFTNREVAFSLNEGGSDGGASSDIWMQGAEYPVFSDGSQKPIRKVIFCTDDKTTACFTNAEGKVDWYPPAHEGYQWLGFSEDQVFEENTWIYQAPAKMSISTYEDNKELENDFYISTPEELNKFRELSKKDTFKGKTIHLMANIDMSNTAGLTAAEIEAVQNWNGIGKEAAPFGGTFDGHGYTISNMKSTQTGLFLALGSVDGSIAQPTVKNFTLSNSHLGTAENPCLGNGKGLVVSRIYGYSAKNGTSWNSQVLNVHVINSELCAKQTYNSNNEINKANSYGIIVGREGTTQVGNKTENYGAVTISGCTVTNTDMKCYATEGDGTGSWGFIMGRDLSRGYSRIIGCTVTNCNMTTETSKDANGNTVNPIVLKECGGIVGHVNSDIEIEECTVDNVTIDVNKDSSKVAQHLGGIIGQCNSATGMTIADCTVLNTNIKTAGQTTYVGLIAGEVSFGKISGVKVNNSQINATYNGELQSGLIGGIIGRFGNAGNVDTLNKAVLEHCQLEGITINVASKGSYAIGGIVGRLAKDVDAKVENCVAKNIKINSNYAATEDPGSYSFGGAIGHIQEVAVVKNVTVEGIQIDSAKAYRNSGGFVGMVQGAQPSVFENCKVTAYKKGDTTISSHIYENKEGKTFDDTDYSFNVGGFAGLVISDSEFSLCTVDTMDVFFKDRIRGFGGIVGTIYDLRKDIAQNSSANIYAEGKVEGTGIVTINRCASNNITISSGGASYFLGGIVGGLSEGSIVTNCLIDSFSHKSTSSNNVGAVVGRLYNTDTSNVLEAILKNNYIQNCNIDVGATAGIVLGGCVGLRDGQNNYYYDTVLKVLTTDANNLGQQYNHSTEVNDASILTNKKLAYNLNTTNGTEPHNGSWAQGATNPIIADENNAAIAYVTYLRYNGDNGYGGMEYLVFPIKADGTINYAEGTRKFIRQDKITNDNQINRQPLEEGVKEQEKIDLSKNHYKEVWVEEACSYSGEPEANNGRVWQYPEGKITTDVTITQVEKTAWDFNGDTKLSVSDLVRLKKSEKANYNGNTCKASKIGTMLTNADYDKKTPNSGYVENQGDLDADGKIDLSTDGYLPSYRLRRVILTPPSTSVSVLSYNLYYASKSDLIPDAERQAAIKSMLGLERGANDQVAGEYSDNTKSKADIIALQEVSADFWHDTIYKSYLAPYQYGTDKNGNGKIDPSELDTTQGSGGKKYYTYEHFGRGRYGHVFYNTEGSAFAGDSYTLIIYNQYKYRYKDGDSGTIYFSDTPTVASHGWGEDIPYDDPLLDSQRAANWAIFTDKATGEKFMFVNIHLSHSEEGKDRQSIRMKQMELVLRRIKEILGQESRKYGLGEASGGMPIIIAGDFNAYIGTDAYNYALEYGYEDARETAAVSSEMHGAFNNWTTTDPSKYSYGDHFLVNDRARVQTYEVIDGDETDTGDSHIDYTLYQDKYHYSDHCPIRATIDIGSDYLRSTTEAINGLDYKEVYRYNK